MYHKILSNSMPQVRYFIFRNFGFVLLLILNTKPLNKNLFYALFYEI